MRLFPVAFALMAGLGCSPPPEAPSDLDALMGFVFAHADDEETAPVEQALGNLSVWMHAHGEATLEGYQVNDLEGSTLEAFGAGALADESLVGASLGFMHQFPADWLGTDNAISPDHDLSVPPDPLEGRVYSSDAACFRDRSCDTLESAEWSTDDLPLLITSRVHWQQYWRRIDVPAGTAVVQRWWIDRPIEFNVNFLTVAHQYYLWVFLPQDDGSAVSVQATWISAELTGAPIPENTALSLVVNTMGKAAASLEDRVGGWHGSAEESAP
jgi:hypothetical protein